MHIGILLELLNLFARLNYVISNLADRTTFDALQDSVDYRVEWPQSSSGHHRALQQSLISHLQDSLGGHIGSSASLLPLPDNSLQYVDYLIIQLVYTQVSLVFTLLFASFLLQNILNGAGILVLEQLVWKSLDDDFDDSKKVLLDEVQKVLYLLDLQMGWLEDLWRRCVVVDDSDREDLESHLMTDVSPGFIVFDCFLELGH